MHSADPVELRPWQFSPRPSAYGAGGLGGAAAPPPVGEKIVLFGQNWCTVRAKKQ